MLACYTLLRILKSSFAKYLDFEKSKRTFFLGIDIAKRLSTENNDIATKNAVILARLWNSDKIFRLADGREYTTLKVRSRLAMGVVLDAVWWYRQEYGGFSGLQLSRQDESRIGMSILAISRAAKRIILHFLPPIWKYQEPHVLAPVNHNLDKTMFCEVC